MSSFLEIVELINGDIVLQRADGDGEALMTIRFSDESKSYMPNGRLEVARAMIHAGIETASQMHFVNTDANEDSDEELGDELAGSFDEADDFDDADAPRVLH